MNKYELAVVINGKLDDETRDQAFSKVKEYVEKFGGNITNVDEWGKRKLAYEINKIKEGYYYIITFESGAEAPAEIERNLRINEAVIRFLCIRVEE